MNANEKHMWGHTLLRVTIGLLFLFAGIRKFGNPDGIIGMLGNIGFPAASAVGWILILAEVIFGLLVFIGYKTKKTAWPLAVILLVAWILVVLPGGDGFYASLTSSNSFFHLMGVAGSAVIALTGPGLYSMTKE